MTARFELYFFHLELETDPPPSDSSGIAREGVVHLVVNVVVVVLEPLFDHV
nr:hypothetical protein [Tanacetum cinerariifolium]